MPEMFTVSAGKGLQLRFTVPEKVHSVRKCSPCQKRFTVSEDVQKMFTMPEKFHSAGKCSQCLKMFTATVVLEKVYSY